VDIPSGGNFNYFNNMYMLGRTGSSSPANQIVAGSNIPAGPVVVEFSYKCPSITSFLVNIKANGTTVGAVTPKLHNVVPDGHGFRRLYKLFRSGVRIRAWRG